MLYLNHFNFNDIDNPTELFIRKLQEAAFQYIDIETLYDDIMTGKNLVLQGHLNSDVGNFAFNSFGCNAPAISSCTIVPNSIEVFKGLFYSGPDTVFVTIELLRLGIKYSFGIAVFPAQNNTGDFGVDLYKSYSGRLQYFCTVGLV
ncbi:MAG: hypothetical protein RSF40_04810 [Oscillospiraceae bacterium]